MARITLGIFAILLISCKNFETKRVCSDDIFQEEVKEINWKEIETYPAFASCEQYSDQKRQHCFEKTFSSHIYTFLAQKTVIVNDSIQEKLVLHLSISAKGKPSLDSVTMNQTLIEKLPEFRTWLDSSVITLPKIYPARKRGIPVATNFKLPLQIESE